ncbi:MAG TPA: alpha/beta hydrolase [Thermoanaerobaculia bacterium]|nr:alpha/beta hydrolase [Thermoanaerobaculia bacterium]
MTSLPQALRTSTLGVLAASLSLAAAAAPVVIAGASCESPAPLHCPDADCPGELIIHPGNAVEPKTGRQFFLDYPCDLEPGEKVMFVLSLHGGGSIGNWQRHYFPLLDLKDEHRLVVATPSGVVRAWTAENDDEHLRNIVELVYEQLGPENISAFWLAGHSQGGQTSNRLLTTDFFRERLTGWVSLSGGRLGSKREEVRAPIPSAPGAPPRPPAAADGTRPPIRLVADASILPEYAFSHIYSSGEHELTEAGLPASSKWAEKLGCGARERRPDVVDDRAGYVYDTREQANPNRIWGLQPRPGTAEVYVYPGCEGGHLVADVIRLDKGHTEGLEPNVTEAIVELMLSVGPKPAASE